jgi:hypothetical protein
LILMKACLLLSVRPLETDQFVFVLVTLPVRYTDITVQCSRFFL